MTVLLNLKCFLRLRIIQLLSVYSIYIEPGIIHLSGTVAVYPFIFAVSHSFAIGTLFSSSTYTRFVVVFPSWQQKLSFLHHQTKSFSRKGAK